jgi:hypothetical protein
MLVPVACPLVLQANNMVLNKKTEQVFFSAFDISEVGDVVFELDINTGNYTKVLSLRSQVQSNLCAYASATNSFILVRLAFARARWVLG